MKIGLIDVYFHNFPNLALRWCNNHLVFRTEPDFYKFDPKRG